MVNANLAVTVCPMFDPRGGFAFLLVLPYRSIRTFSLVFVV